MIANHDFDEIVSPKELEIAEIGKKLVFTANSKNYALI